MRPGIYLVEYVAESKVGEYDLSDYVIANNAQSAIDKVSKHVLAGNHIDDNDKEYPITKFLLISVKIDQEAEY